LIQYAVTCVPLSSERFAASKVPDRLAVYMCSATSYMRVFVRVSCSREQPSVVNGDGSMNASLWVVQAILALTFAGSGAAKATMSKQRMIETGQTGVQPFPLAVIRLVAVAEILGAIGLILPWAIGTARVLTPAAAAGLTVVMIGAAASHWSLREYKQVFGVNLVLALMLVFVMIGRATAL
jgi:uncharacterized membrane protein YphA (DoxX/SURF4 family)